MSVDFFVLGFQLSSAFYEKVFEVTEAYSQQQKKILSNEISISILISYMENKSLGKLRLLHERRERVCVCVFASVRESRRERLCMRPKALPCILDIK